MIRINKLVTTGFLIALTLICSAFYILRPNNTHTKSKAPVPLVLGFRPTVVVDLALLEAVESGLFKQAGIEVTMRAFGRADLLFGALQSGEIQGSAGIPIEPLLSMAEKGQYPYHGYLVWYFDPINPYDGFVVRKDSSIKTISDLSNKTVGSHPSRQVKLFVSKMLPSSVVQEYNPASPLLGLASGSLDAAFVLEPVLSQAITTGEYRVIEPGAVSRFVFGGMRVPAALSLLSQSWISANPKEAAKFVRIAQNAQCGKIAAIAKANQIRILGQPKYGGFSQAVAENVVEPVCSMPNELDQLAFKKYELVLRGGGLLSSDVETKRLLYFGEN